MDRVGDHEQGEDPFERFVEEAVEDPTGDPLRDGREWIHVADVAQVQVAGELDTGAERSYHFVDHMCADRRKT